MVNKDVFVGEGGPLHKAVLKGIEVTIGESADIAKEFAEVEGRVNIEEITEEYNNI